MAKALLEIQRHGIMNLVSSAGITAIGFLATMFYAHWIGPGVLGTYFVFLSMFGILSLFCDFGISLASTQRISDGNDPDAYYSASVMLRMCLFVILVLGLILFGGYLFKDNYVTLNSPDIFWALIIVLGISTLGSCVSAGIGAGNRLGLLASTSLINNIVKIVLQVITVFLGWSLFGLIGGLLIGVLIQLIIELRFVDYRIKKFSWKHIQGLFSYSRWAFLITICLVLFESLNALVIVLFLPVSDVGIFGVCWTFSIFAIFVSTALCNTLYVKVIRWNVDRDWNAIATSLEKAITYSLIFALPILAGGIILGQRLLYYFYGAVFAAGFMVLIVIIIMRVFQSLSQLFIRYLMSSDRVQHAFTGLLLGIVANIVLAFVLIPVLGLIGAALASLVNVLIIGIVSAHYLREIIPIRFENKKIIHLFIATLLMAVFLVMGDFIITTNSAVITVARVAFGAVVYFTVILIGDREIREDVVRTLRIQWIP